MLKREPDVERGALLRLIELKPAEMQEVAGGSPTLPLPPPCRAMPWPSPW
jgi:hypothetical protein